MAQQVKIEYKTVWEAQPGPQTWLIQCPIFETLFGGARGGGKSDGILGEFVTHADEYGQEAIALCVRRDRTQLLELIERSRFIYSQLGAHFDRQDSMWRFPNGARFRFAYLESDEDASHYQGHSYTRIYVEEMGTFPNPEPIFKLMATLSRNPNVRCRFIATANPGGPGHLWIKQRYIDPDPKGMRVIRSVFTNPWNNEKIVKERIFIPSKISDNKYTNTNEYIGNLFMAGNAELVKAWLKGDWNVMLGAYFPEFNEDRHVINTFTPPKHWTRFISMDWGSSTPFCIGWYCVVPDEYDSNLEIPTNVWARTHEQQIQGILPKGAIIKYREWYGSLWRKNIEDGLPNADSITPNTGLKLTAPEVARGIALREAHEPRNSRGRPDIAYRIADPKIFSSDNGPSVAEEMGAKPYYIDFSRADNKRVSVGGPVSGWDQLRARLKGKPLDIKEVEEENLPGIPMIYFMDCCLDTIRTLPALQHDPKRLEDALKTNEDHAPDETRYACMSRPYSRTHSDQTVRRFIAQKDNAIVLNDNIEHLRYTPSFNEGRIH